MNTFEYFSVKNVKEACTLLSEYGEEAKLLAGGQALLNLMRERLVSPSFIVDIKGLSDFDYIRYDEETGLRIGALTTHRSLEKSDVVREKFAMLAEMEMTLASVAIRNWGTVGGNLCHADPASDLAPSLMALGAEVTLTGVDGERVLNLNDFFVDYFETKLRSDEVLTEIHVPIRGLGGGAYMKFAARATDLPVVGVATYIVLDRENRDVCKDIRIVMGSVGPKPLRSKRAEDILRGQAITDKGIEEAARLSSIDAQPVTDINGSEEFKREIVKVLVKRTIRKAVGRARTL